MAVSSLNTLAQDVANTLSAIEAALKTRSCEHTSTCQLPFYKALKNRASHPGY